MPMFGTLERGTTIHLVALSDVIHVLPNVIDVPERGEAAAICREPIRFERLTRLTERHIGAMLKSAPLPGFCMFGHGVSASERLLYRVDGANEGLTSSRSTRGEGRHNLVHRTDDEHAWTSQSSDG